jgi:hypothetical protein
MPPKKTFTFSIPEDLKEGLRTVRERDGISEAEQIRRGIAMWLEKRGTRKSPSPKTGARKKA